MLVRITRAPAGVIDGFDVSNLKVGSVYDLPTSLASVLILEEFGISEMRGTAADDSGKRERKSDPQQGQ